MTVADLARIDPRLGEIARRTEEALEENFWPREGTLEAEKAKRAADVELYELHEYARSCREGAQGKDAQELARAFWSEHTVSIYTLRAFRKAALKVAQAERRNAAEKRRERSR